MHECNVYITIDIFVYFLIKRLKPLKHFMLLFNYYKKQNIITSSLHTKQKNKIINKRVIGHKSYKKKKLLLSPTLLKKRKI